MVSLSQAQVIEYFHLAFLNVLPTHVRKDNYVVKGGANLRYFFRSHRYSEDIDFDALLGEGWKLTEQVDAALATKALELLLRSRDITVVSVNKHKQTETTRRWKLLLATPDREPISTKVEFSRRNGDDRFDVETVDANVANHYGLLRPSLQRYRAEPATEQKIAALALRGETQARDVFDLDWLFRNYGAGVKLGSIGATRLEHAADRAAELPFDAYRAQVVPFLEPEVAEIYGTEDAWTQMQMNVLEELTRLNADN